jgi:hypothetical protein
MMWLRLILVVAGVGVGDDGVDIVANTDIN